MTKPMKTSGSRVSKVAPFAHITQVKRALQFQLMFVTLFAFITVFFFDLTAARAVFLGALVAWLSQAVFAWSVFRYAGARANTAIVQSLFRGQFLKWAVCFMGFMLIFMLHKPEKPIFVLVGFILLTLTNWGYVLLGRR